MRWVVQWDVLDDYGAIIVRAKRVGLNSQNLVTLINALKLDSEGRAVFASWCPRIGGTRIGRQQLFYFA